MPFGPGRPAAILRYASVYLLLKIISPVILIGDNLFCNFRLFELLVLPLAATAIPRPLAQTKIGLDRRNLIIQATRSYSLKKISDVHRLFLVQESNQGVSNTVIGHYHETR